MFYFTCNHGLTVAVTSIVVCEMQYMILDWCETVVVVQVVVVVVVLTSLNLFQSHIILDQRQRDKITHTTADWINWIKHDGYAVKLTDEVCNLIEMVRQSEKMFQKNRPRKYWWLHQREATWWTVQTTEAFFDTRRMR